MLLRLVKQEIVLVRRRTRESRFEAAFVSAEHSDEDIAQTIEAAGRAFETTLTSSGPSFRP